ncbi:uncharacterized [Tachysurus ichikawai]
MDQKASEPDDLTQNGCHLPTREPCGLQRTSLMTAPVQRQMCRPRIPTIPVSKRHVHHLADIDLNKSTIKPVVILITCVTLDTLKELVSIPQQRSVYMYAIVYPPPPAPQPELDHLTTVSCYIPESLHRGPFKGAQRALFGVINKTLVLDKKRMDALWNIFTACLGMCSVHAPSQNSTPLLQQATEPRASWDSWSWRGWSVGGG